MRKASCYFLILVLMLSNCTDDEIENPINEDELTLRLEQILKKSDFPGFTIGIVKNGNVGYQRSFGLRNIENNSNYTNQTIQPIASISKTFLGVATVKAIELGYFNLETPINEILRKTLVNPKYPSGEILVRHLTNHTSGLVDEEDTYLSSYYILEGQSEATRGAQILQQYGIVKHAPKSLSEFINAYYYEGCDYYSLNNFANQNPGETENYSNVASSLMAFIIELSSGMSYQNFLETYIFIPLEMSDTSFEYDLSNSNTGTLYFNKDIPLPLYGLESFPDGALKTTNEDLMKFLVNMIEGQRGESSTLFPKDFYQLLFTETSSTYSIFWDIDPGTNAFGHSGGDPGIISELHFSGSANAGFFVMGNYDASTDDHEEHYDEVFDEMNKVVNMFLSNTAN